MVKKTKKVTTKKIAQKTDWKFVTIIVVLTIIGVGVFLIFRGLAAQNPEIFYGYPRGHHLNQETIDARKDKADGKSDGTTPGNNTNGGTNALKGGGTGMSADRFNSMMNQRREDARNQGTTGNCRTGYTYSSATNSCNLNKPTP